MLGPYAVGALRPDEAAAVADHLPGCAPCQQVMADLTVVVTRLKESAPPTHIWSRIESALRETPADGERSDETPP